MDPVKKPGAPNPPHPPPLVGPPKPDPEFTPDTSPPAPPTVPAARPPLPPAELSRIAATAPFSAPSAAELLHAIGKSLQPRWRQFYRETAGPTPANRYQAALALGALITDLILAALARDTQQVRNLLQDIEGFETMLGVTQRMRPRVTRVSVLAEAGEWDAVRRDADALAIELSVVFEQLRDGDLARLVPAGTWLRALQLDAQIREEDPQKSGPPAALEADFIEWLRTQWAGLSSVASGEQIVAQCRRAMNIFDQWRSRDATLQQQVTAASGALTDLLRQFHTS